jgi:hypothetical protein
MLVFGPWLFIAVLLLANGVAVPGGVALGIGAHYWRDYWRWREHWEAEHVEKQVAEDTCDEHGVFCCSRCFDMSTSRDKDGRAS